MYIIPWSLLPFEDCVHVSPIHFSIERFKSAFDILIITLEYQETLKFLIMSQIKPYQISVPDSSLAQLKAKLSASTFPIESDFSDSWEYGTPLSDIKRLAK